MERSTRLHALGTRVLARFNCRTVDGVGKSRGGKDSTPVRLCLRRRRDRAAVASGILPDVEGGILPPGTNVRNFSESRNFRRARLCVCLVRRARSPALRQAGCPPLRGKVRPCRNDLPRQCPSTAEV